MSVVSYECPIAGETHDVPSVDVRVLRVADGRFVVACDCGPEPLEEADSKPHPTTDHLVNIDGRDPSPEEWLDLNDAADGWYQDEPWDIFEKHGLTYGEWWASLRSGIEDLAESEDGRDLKPSDEEVRGEGGDEERRRRRDRSRDRPDEPVVLVGSKRAGDP